MIVKIILDKKVIEEEEDSLPYIWKSDLITHSKEVEEFTKKMKMETIIYIQINGI